MSEITYNFEMHSECDFYYGNNLTASDIPGTPEYKKRSIAGALLVNVMKDVSISKYKRERGDRDVEQVIRDALDFVGSDNCKRCCELVDIDYKRFVAGIINIIANRRDGKGLGCGKFGIRKLIH